MKDTITKIQPSDLISDSMVKINRNFEIISNRDDVTESKLNQWAERIENQLADIRNDNGIISDTLLNNVQKLENKINNITNLDGIAKEVQNIVNNASTDVEKLINDKAGEAISSRLGDYVKTSTLNKTLGGYVSSTAFDTYRSDSSKSSAQSSRVVANSKFLKLPNGDIDCLVRISGEITEFKSVEDYFKSLSASEKATILGDKTFSSDDKALEDPDVVSKLIEVCERTFKTIVSEMSVISQEVGDGFAESSIISTVNKNGKAIVSSIFVAANEGGSKIALNADHINIEGEHALTVKSTGNINIESGGNFIINSGGKFQIESDNFNIDKDGTVSVNGAIEATSLKITGSNGSMVDISDETKLANFVKGHQDDKWLKDALNGGTTINGGLVLSNAILTKDIANNITAGMIGSNNTESDIRFFAGTSSTDLSDIENVPFKVLEDGTLIATKATISGEITANEFSAEKSQSINYDNKPYVVTKSTTITGDTFEIGLSKVPDDLNKFSGNKVYIKLVNELQDESGTISKDKTLHCVPVLCMKYCGKEYMLSPASWISSPLPAEMWWEEIGNVKEYSRINPNGANYFFETTYGNCYMYDNVSGILESENVNLCQLNYSVSDEAYKNEVEEKLLGTIPPLIDSNSKKGKYKLNVTANVHVIVNDSNCKIFVDKLSEKKHYGISSELKTKSNSDTDLNKYGLQKARDFIKKILKDTGGNLPSSYSSVYGWYNGPIGSGSSSSVTFDANDDIYRLIPFLTVTENNNYGGLETGDSTIKVDIQYTPIKGLIEGGLINTVNYIDFTIIYTINCKYKSTGSNNQITINGNKYNVSEGKFILKCNCILNMNAPYEDTYDKPTDTDNVWKTYLPDCFDKINFNDISVNTQNVFNFTGEVQISGAADNYIHIEKKS